MYPTFAILYDILTFTLLVGSMIVFNPYPSLLSLPSLPSIQLPAPVEKLASKCTFGYCGGGGGSSSHSRSAANHSSRSRGAASGFQFNSNKNTGGETTRPMFAVQVLEIVGYMILSIATCPIIITALSFAFMQFCGALREGYTVHGAASKHSR
uniref:Uncharacterized protein n=1 Tax=Lygus hesperus TaxID=30085 RepID=A0A146LJI7_LYGHE